MDYSGLKKGKCVNNGNLNDISLDVSCERRRQEHH